jgi:hypothetical protein
MVISVKELTDLLEDAQIEPTSNNIKALSGMLSVGVFSPEECLNDLRAYIEVGAVWV